MLVLTRQGRPMSCSATSSPAGQPGQAGSPMTWTRSSTWRNPSPKADAGSESRKRLLCNSRWLLTEQLVDLVKLSSTPPDCCSMPPPSAGMARQDDALDETCQSPRRIHPTVSVSGGKAWPAGPLGSRPGSASCIGLVLGMGGAFAQMLPPYRVGLVAPWAGAQMMSWITSQDLVRAMLFPRARRVRRLFNGTAPQPVSNRRFSEISGATLHRPHLFFVPALLRLPDGRGGGSAATGQRCCRPVAAGRFHFTYPALPWRSGQSAALTR